MDGFAESSGVVVLAATNRVDILDQALTRPGRFDRQITVDKPDIQGRKEIFEVHLRDIKTKGEAEEYAGRLAGLTPGMAGADIANMCNEAAIVAARRKADHVEMEDFEQASDRVIGGLTSNKLISDKEKEVRMRGLSLSLSLGLSCIANLVRDSLRSSLPHRSSPTTRPATPSPGGSWSTPIPS